jgi:hypothetical protein
MESFLCLFRVFGVFRGSPAVSVAACPKFLNLGDLCGLCVRTFNHGKQKSSRQGRKGRKEDSTQRRRDSWGILFPTLLPTSLSPFPQLSPVNPVRSFGCGFAALCLRVIFSDAIFSRRERQRSATRNF